MEKGVAPLKIFIFLPNLINMFYQTFLDARRKHQGIPNNNTKNWVNLKMGNLITSELL